MNSENNKKQPKTAEVRVKTEILSGPSSPENHSKNLLISIKDLCRKIKQEPCDDDNASKDMSTSSLLDVKPVIKQERKKNVAPPRPPRPLQLHYSPLPTLPHNYTVPKHRKYTYRAPQSVNLKTFTTSKRYKWKKKNTVLNMTSVTHTPGNRNAENSPSTNSIEKVNKANYLLIVSNIPTSWSYVQIKNYLNEEIGPVGKMVMLTDAEEFFLGSIQLEFDFFLACRQAKLRLDGKEIEGNRMSAKINGTPQCDSDDDMDTSEPQNKRKKTNDEEPWRPEVDVWETDPKGLYGLEPNFLKTLNITVPINKWIYVSNFRCDRAELRDVLELAGQVLVCNVVYSTHRYAKVMYSHPLEAVQAVSILHNQSFYGLKLKVQMDLNPDDTAILPKGLASLGPGLGETGKIVRDIVRQYERYAKGRSSWLNKAIFSKTNVNMTPKFIAESDANESPFRLFVKNPFASMHHPASTRQGSMNSQNETSVNPGPQNATSLNPVPQNVTTQNSGPQNVSSLNSGSQIVISVDNGPQNLKSSNLGSQNVTSLNRDSQNVIASNTGLQNVIPLNSGPQNVTSLKSGPQNESLSNIGPQNVTSGNQSNLNQSNPEPMKTSTLNRPIQMAEPSATTISVPNDPTPLAGPSATTISTANDPIPMAGPNTAQTFRPNDPRIVSRANTATITRPNSHVPMAGSNASPNFRPNMPMPMRMPGPIAPSISRPICSAPVAGPKIPQVFKPNCPIRMQGPSTASISRPNCPVSMTRTNTAQVFRPQIPSDQNVALEISNLPLSTTFPLLCGKMAECGQVMSLQFTTPGCAVVQFAQRAHANMCFQKFNKYCVQGNTLVVTYLT